MKTKTNKKAKKETTDLLGYVSVDSGQLMIADPCRVTGDGALNDLTEASVKFDTAYGDGHYPVFGHFEDGKLVGISCLFGLEEAVGGPF